MITFRLEPGRALALRMSTAAIVLVLACGGPAHAQSAPGAASIDPPAAPGSVADRKDLPSARSVLDRHVEAIGGRAAILSHSSTYAQGTLSMPAAGVSGTLEVFAAKPDKTLLRISLGGVGEVVEGFNGTHGWSVSPMTGPMLLEGRQLEEKRFDAEYHSELRDDSRYASIATIDQTEFDGRPCYKLRLVRKTGGEDFEFYDVKTGLKAGGVSTRETAMGKVTATTVETDYRRFGNLMQPTTVRSQVGAMQQVITITQIEYDKVPPSAFEMPAEIKALLK